jgi:hypothetical protein
MNNLTKNLVIASLALTAFLPLSACNKTHEKTTTVVKEAKPTEEKEGVEVNINAGGVDIKVKSDD